MKAAPLPLELVRAGPAHGALGAALRRAWAAPRSAQAVVLVLAAWLVLAGNLALWRSVFALEPGPGGMPVGVSGAPRSVSDGGSDGVIAAIFSAFGLRESAKIFRRNASLRLIYRAAAFVTHS